MALYEEDGDQYGWGVGAVIVNLKLAVALTPSGIGFILSLKKHSLSVVFDTPVVFSCLLRTSYLTSCFITRRIAVLPCSESTARARALLSDRLYCGSGRFATRAVWVSRPNADGSALCWRDDDVNNPT